MERIKIYKVDAFTDKLFSGNPAGVCLLDKWLPDETMQNIAFENNLAETAFVLVGKDTFEIRWFTPLVEVDLCGHATLASAKIIFDYTEFYGDEVTFISHRSGILTVRRESKGFTLVFPVDSYTKVTEIPDEVFQGLKTRPLEVYKGKTDYLCVFGLQSDISDMVPDLTIIGKLDGRGVIVTAPGDTVDFVSRFFAPQSGIPEDPVTGSAHTTLTPYWVQKLNRNPLSAEQISKRGGKLQCKLDDDKVEITGNAIVFLEGEILLYD